MGYGSRPVEPCDSSNIDDPLTHLPSLVVIVSLNICKCFHYWVGLIEQILLKSSFHWELRNCRNAYCTCVPFFTTAVVCFRYATWLVTEDTVSVLTELHKKRWVIIPISRLIYSGWPSADKNSVNFSDFQTCLCLWRHRRCLRRIRSWRPASAACTDTIRRRKNCLHSSTRVSRVSWSTRNRRFCNSTWGFVRLVPDYYSLRCLQMTNTAWWAACSLVALLPNLIMHVMCSTTRW